MLVFVSLLSVFQVVLMLLFLSVLLGLYVAPLYITSPCIMDPESLGPRPDVIGQRGAPMVSQRAAMFHCPASQTLTGETGESFDVGEVKWIRQKVLAVIEGRVAFGSFVCLRRQKANQIQDPAPSVGAPCWSLLAQSASQGHVAIWFIQASFFFFFINTWINFWPWLGVMQRLCGMCRWRPGES